METDKAGHEAEESLILAPLSAVHQTENLITKLQNGNQLPEVLPQQTNGDASWNHFKPNEGVNQMKRHGEKCSSPVGVQDQCDQSPHLKNWGTKHALSEPSLLGLHQSKKLKVDAEINGQDDDVIASWDKTKSVGMASKVDCFPDHSRTSPLESDGHKLDNNNCSFSDGDIYSLSSNKQLAFPNGATVTSPSMEATHGDLLEKTLSQYYPDHISIASQSRLKEDSFKNPISNGMPEKTLDSPTLSSGLPISSHKSESGQQERTSPDMHCHSNNGCNASVLDEPQQQSFPLQDTTEAQDPCVQPEQGPQPVRPVESSESQNSTEGSSDGMKALSMSPHSDQEFGQDSSSGLPLQSWERERFSPFTNNSMAAIVGGKDTDLSHPSKDLNPELNSQVSQELEQVEAEQQTQLMGSSEFYSQQGSPGPARSSQPNSVQPTKGAPIQEPASPSIVPQAKGKNETNNLATFKGEVEEVLQRADAYPELGWIDLNSSQPPQTLDLPETWKDFCSQPQQEHHANVQSQCQVQNLGPMQRFQKQGCDQSNFHQQDKQMHNAYKPEQNPIHDQMGYKTMPEWQQPQPKTPTTQHKEPQMQNNESQYSTSQQQVENQFHTQTHQENLFEGTQDIEKLLESGYLQQQQPMSTHQSEGQMVRTALQLHLSQNSQIMGESNSQLHGPSQRQLDEYIRLERELKSSSCKPQNQQVQHQTEVNQTARTSPGFSPTPLPNAQTQHDAMFGYSHASAHEDCKYNAAAVVQQRPYSQGSVAQYSQQNQIQPQPNHTRFPPSHQPPQGPPGAFNQQPSVQMYPKSESQESCAQFRQEQLQNHREFQKHAALRMHLLQKQERQGHQQSLENFRHILQTIKHEAGSRMEPPIAQQDKVLLTPAMQAMIKKEHPDMACEQSQNRSIIATMEQQLKQYQLSPVFEKKSLVVKSPNKVKVETSGPVTILSTNADLGGEDLGTMVQSNTTSGVTPTKKMEPNLNSFLESPLKLLDTPIKNLLDTPNKTQYEIPSCHCVEQISEKDEGPYYTHLGAAPNVSGVRELMEKRFGQTGSAIRIEKVVYTGKEGKSTQGCPIAKWVIRRASLDEKLLVLVRERAGHTCETAAIVVVILIWEGIPATLADQLYGQLSDTLRRHGALTNRRCAHNEERTCACQGLDPETCGASFSFGCSWSMYYNGCKFARSKIPRKFRLLGDDSKEEEKIEQHLQNLATLIAPKYKQMAPAAYGNQVEFEHRAPDCRLGLKEGRPFSGVTACLDFCAHAHRDLHNMPGGSTVVCTLTSEDNREVGKIPEDEQLHVLPLYKTSPTDEFGSVEGQQEKMKSGAIQVLSTFRRKVRMLAEPAKSCRQRKLEAKKGGANKPLNHDTQNAKAEKALQATLKQSTLKNTGQDTPVSGAQPGQLHMGASPMGNLPNPLSAQHQQQQQLQPPNGNASSPLPARLPQQGYPSSAYPGYQCNGSIPPDNFCSYYSSNQKHMDAYPHQRPQMYPQQQYSPHPQYRVEYPPRYDEHSLQVNGYSNCNMRPNVHPLGPYSPFGPNSVPNSQFPPAMRETTMDYGAVSKSSQYNGYPNPYPDQSPQMYLQDKDPFSSQIKQEMNLHDAHGMAQVLPQLGTEHLTPTHPEFRLPNGNIQGIAIKQESQPEIQDSVKKEDVWSDNEHNFLDPEIGGVAVAPSHGSILIECAKRELHATTPLKNPDRNHPTRISLVFYQHKNMIEAKHGLALWEAKMAEKTREKELDAEKHGAEGTPTKNKRVKREHPEVQENADLPFKRFIQTLTEKSMSCTTNTYVSTSPYAFTKVTGPYNRYV
ncbi:hypothetical protein AGOR_G00233230 [Albula goreensis]|uniref:Methylcytosine dioxygenase TET n=1 Tax=Albula goreensis TaxID=1534307 RepID=A0A8T3CEY2_9TELE|nr:hypothetical protein AGOR_G00233230 [Albula goreensis]